MIWLRILQVVDVLGTGNLDLDAFILGQLYEHHTVFVHPPDDTLHALERAVDKLYLAVNSGGVGTDGRVDIGTQTLGVFDRRRRNDVVHLLLGNGDNGRGVIGVTMKAHVLHLGTLFVVHLHPRDALPVGKDEDQVVDGWHHLDDIDAFAAGRYLLHGDESLKVPAFQSLLDLQLLPVHDIHGKPFVALTGGVVGGQLDARGLVGLLRLFIRSKGTSACIFDTSTTRAGCCNSRLHYLDQIVGLHDMFKTAKL